MNKKHIKLLFIETSGCWYGSWLVILSIADLLSFYQKSHEDV